VRPSFGSTSTRWAKAPEATQFYSPAAVYCVTPTTEDLARSFARSNVPRPIERWEISAPASTQRELPLTKERTCRVCGCTEDNCEQCIEKTGEPCHWVERDLCSACVGDIDEIGHGRRAETELGDEDDDETDKALDQEG
jgi:hypothetical protein